MKVEITVDKILCSDSFQYRQSCHYGILTIAFVLLRLSCNHTLHFSMSPLPFAFHLSLFFSFSASFLPLSLSLSLSASLSLSLSLFHSIRLSLSLSFTLCLSHSLSLTPSFSSLIRSLFLFLTLEFHPI